MRSNVVPWTLLVCTTVVLFGCTRSTATHVLRERGERALLAGNYQQAAVEFEEVTSRYPGDWQAQYMLGRAYLDLGRPADARRALEVAHSLKPRNAEVAEALAEAIYQQGDETRLFIFLREQTETTQSVRSYLLLAKYAMASGDADSAKVALETAIVIDNGQTVEPYLEAATFAERLGDPDLAVRRLRQAYGIDPQSQQVNERLIALGEVPGLTLVLPPGR